MWRLAGAIALVLLAGLSGCKTRTPAADMHEPPNICANDGVNCFGVPVTHLSEHDLLAFGTSVTLQCEASSKIDDAYRAACRQSLDAGLQTMMDRWNGRIEFEPLGEDIPLTTSGGCIDFTTKGEFGFSGGWCHEQLSAVLHYRWVTIEDAQFCEVLENPITYDHKLLRVTGQVVRDFETFWIESAECDDVGHHLWIEYGGPKPADGPDWHGEIEHPPDGLNPLWVEGVRTWLDADSTFRKFDSTTKSLKRGHTAHATIVGRFFAAGTYKDDKGEDQEVGYGPYGMYSLFVIQKVESVSRQ